MVAGGIYSYGLINLIIIECSENEFEYVQALFDYQEDFRTFKENGAGDFFFEQDGATPHTCESNK